MPDGVIGVTSVFHLLWSVQAHKLADVTQGVKNGAGCIVIARQHSRPEGLHHPGQTL